MKEKYSAVWLARLGGAIGLHKFYLGKITSGVLYAVFSWTFIPLILSFIDSIYYLFMDAKKFDEKYNTQKSKSAKDKNQKAADGEISKQNIERLTEAKRLLDDGALTEDEFDMLKSEILGADL